jgi:two-component system, NtrC family, nitrogen regulation response regulator NtrX
MSEQHILVVDDESAIRRTLKDILEYEDYFVDEAADGEQALEKARAKRYNLIMLDIKMPRMDGIEVMAVLAREMPEVPVIMISGHGTIDTAVECTKLGAYNFIEKPPDLNRLLLTVRNALERSVLVNENQKIRKALTENVKPLTPILGDSPQLQQVRSLIEKVAPTAAPVLITGEIGTGKALAAHWIHRLSERSAAPLVEIKCTGIAPEKLEIELFGAEKNILTGQGVASIGKIEQAHGGTLFIEEIADLSLSSQSKLIRLIEEGLLTRIGGDRSFAVDVRLIASSFKNLPQMVEERQFRKELYDHLNVIAIQIPPLRERREDIVTITQYILEERIKKLGGTAKSFTMDARRKLQSFDWYGNVSELSAAIERLLILSEHEYISADEVEEFVQQDDSGNPMNDLLERFDDFSQFRDMAEKVFIQSKLEQFDWNISRTAESIGIQRSHLYNKISKYGIERD